MDAGKTVPTHRALAVDCFNSTWEYLDKPTRTPEEAEAMIHLAHVSFWHWTQVEDHTPQNLSVGLWQLSRVYAVAGLSERAIYFSDRCIQVSEENHLLPFYRGYAFEAMARAKAIVGEKADTTSFVDRARLLAQKVEEVDDQKLLLDDLETIL